MTRDERQAAGQQHAIELAQTGLFQDWRQILHTMHRDEGEPDAQQWLAAAEFQDALDDLCRLYWQGPRS